MKVLPPDPISNGRLDAENTLRLIAALPPPQGLAARIQAVLASPHADAHRPHRQSARLLAWPVRGLQRVWLRSAAAAAIALVVVGGGWGVYSSIQPHMQPWQPGGAVPALPQLSRPGGFSGAGAIRTPQTINGPVLHGPVLKGPVLKGPVLSHTVKMQDAQAEAANRKASKNSAHRSAARNSATRNSATRNSGLHASSDHE